MSLGRVIWICVGGGSSASRSLLLRVLHVGENDIHGGASLAAHKIHTELLRRGVDSRRFVRRKFSSDPCVYHPEGFWANQKIYKSSLVDGFLINKAFSCSSNAAFSNNLFPALSIPPHLINEADVVHLHWMGRSSLNLSQLAKINKPIVWRLPDMFAFTGGCHYSGDCEKYREHCGKCPLLGLSFRYDLSYLNLKKKIEGVRRLKNLVVATPSRWLENCAKSSTVFKDCTVIRVATGVDLNAFLPLEKVDARSKLGLGHLGTKKIISFGAFQVTAGRKGYRELLSSLRYLSDRLGEKVSEYHLLVFGDQGSTLLDTHGFSTSYLGHLDNSEKLSLAYSAADVFIVPSLEENLPNTGIESLACGTPVVGFNVGGMGDLIADQVNGAIADEIGPESLAHSIKWVLEDSVRHAEMCQRARRSAVENFSQVKQVDEYLRIYEDLVGVSERRGMEL